MSTSRSTLHPGTSMWPTMAATGGLLAYASFASLIWPQVLGCAVLGMLGLSLLSVRRAAQLGIRLEMPERVAVGEDLDVTIELTNVAGKGCRALTVRHRLSPGPRVAADSSAYVDRIPARGAAVLRLNRTVATRGVARGSDVEIVMLGAFGFFSRSIAQHFPAPVIAGPPAPDAASLGRVRSQLVESSRLTDVEVSGIRDWRAGDQLRDLHWRSVARSGRPALLERTMPAARCLVVVVLAAPTKQGKCRVDPEFERAISVAAALLGEASYNGEPTCLVVPDLANGGVLHSSEAAAFVDRLAELTTTTPPDRSLMRHAVEHAGCGASVLLVANSTTPGKWRNQLMDVAARADVSVIDVRKWLGETDSLRGLR